MSSFRKKLLDATLGNFRAFRYSIASLFNQPMPAPDTDTPIDVAIPIIPKDLPTLPLCIHAIRKNIPHNIANIYIIAPNNPAIIDAAKSLGATFIDETSVLPGKPSDILIDNPRRQNRKGWLFQQFLKLSAKIGTSKYILFIDADHILLKPHTFLTSDNKIVLYQSKEFYLPYYDNIKKITGKFPLSQYSYIAHKMLFSREILIQLQASLLYSPFAHKLNQKLTTPIVDWKTIISRSIDWTYGSPFSEFELYGNFLPKNLKTHLLWKEKTLKKLPESITGTTPNQNPNPTPQNTLESSPQNESHLDQTIQKLIQTYPNNLSITLPAYLRTEQNQQ